MKKFLKPIAIIVGLLVVLGIGASLAGKLSKTSILNSRQMSVGKSALPMMETVEEGGLYESGAGVQPDAIDSSAGIAEEIPADKKVIKSGNLDLKVKSADDAVGKIAQVAKNNQGEIFSSEIMQSANGKTKNGYVTVKVPVAKFETAFNELKKVASLVLTESVSGQDVTEQYTDLQSRLKNKQAEEASFLKILEQSGEIKDILLVTKEISRVRGEIEVLQGRIRLMDSQTDMSTIMISLTEDANITVVDSWRPWQVIKNSVNALIKNLQGLINFIIRFIIQALPVLLIYALVIWILYRVGKKIFARFRNKNKTENNQ